MPKKNGKLKICVDFGKLNVVTKKDPYSLVDAQSSGSFSTFLHSLQVHTRFFKVIQMDMVVTFLKKINYNIWIIHVQSLINLPKSMWKFVFNVIDVILKFGSPGRKTHKVYKNNSPSKAFKKLLLGQKKKKKKKKKIATHMDLWKYGQILTIQMSLAIKWLRFSKKRFFTWIYHLVLHYILSPNNKFGMWINIIFFILWCST